MTQPMPALCLSAVPGRRATTIALAQEIEERGYTGLYSASFGGGMDFCQTLAQATNSITFGTSIANIYVRHPSDYAQSAAIIHELSEGRFRFGIGVSHAPVNDRLGVNSGKPLTDIKNFVADMRAEERIGDLPPIVLAGLRDKMCATAAEISSGVTFANVARSHVPTTLATMRASHEVDDSFEVWNMIPTVVTDDPQAGAAVCRKTLQMYVRLPNYRNYWKQAGYREEMDAIEAALAARDKEAVNANMTEAWLADCTLFGTAAQIHEGVEAWRDAGVTTPILVPSSTNGGQMKAFSEIFEVFD